jgi:hypothetical protein
MKHPPPAEPGTPQTITPQESQAVAVEMISLVPPVQGRSPEVRAEQDRKRAQWERKADRQFAALMWSEAAHEPDTKVRAVKAREARRMQRDLSYARARRRRRMFQFGQLAPDGPVFVRSYDRDGYGLEERALALVEPIAAAEVAPSPRPRERHAARTSKAGRGSPDGESSEPPAASRWRRFTVDDHYLVVAVGS